MATIEIPNRNCPKCSGIKYRVYERKDGTRDYRCRNEDGCFSLAKAKARQNYHENKHRWPSRIPENHAASWKRLYHSNPIYKERQKLYENRSSHALDDHYVKKYLARLIKRDSGISLTEVTENRIIKVRTYLKVFRQLKQLKNEKEKNN